MIAEEGPLLVVRGSLVRAYPCDRHTTWDGQFDTGSSTAFAVAVAGRPVFVTDEKPGIERTFP